MITMLTNTSTCINCTRFRDTLPSTSSWRSCLSARPADINRRHSESEQQQSTVYRCRHEKGKHQSIVGGRSSLRLARGHGHRQALSNTHGTTRGKSGCVGKCQRYRRPSFRCLHSTSRAPAWHGSFAALCPALTGSRTVEQCPHTHFILHPLHARNRRAQSHKMESLSSASTGLVSTPARCCGYRRMTLSRGWNRRALGGFCGWRPCRCLACPARQPMRHRVQLFSCSLRCGPRRSCCVDTNTESLDYQERAVRPTRLRMPPWSFSFPFAGPAS